MTWQSRATARSTRVPLGTQEQGSSALRAAEPPSLVPRTQLVFGDKIIDSATGEIIASGLDREVLLVEYPSLGEAVAVWAPQRLDDDDQGGGDWGIEWGELDDDVREALNLERSCRRTSCTMRRYMEHNKLTKMWTLTTREGDDLSHAAWLVMRGRMQRFMKKVRRDFFRGRAFPYLYVFERHPKGHGWHVHLFLQDTYIDKRSMDRLWGHGHTHYLDFRKGGKTHDGQWIAAAPRGGRGAARAAARYGAKYGSKTIADETEAGFHRYERSEGFNVPKVTRRVESFDQARVEVQNAPYFGGWDFISSSADWGESYVGPPAWLYRSNPPNEGDTCGPGRERLSRSAP
jgi:hypothetical protein